MNATLPLSYYDYITINWLTDLLLNISASFTHTDCLINTIPLASVFTTEAGFNDSIPQLQDQNLNYVPSFLGWDFECPNQCPTCSSSTLYHLITYKCQCNRCLHYSARLACTPNLSLAPSKVYFQNYVGFTPTIQPPAVAQYTTPTGPRSLRWI